MDPQKDLLEQLEQIETVRGVVIALNRAIEAAMEKLIRGAFRQEEYAVKYAIDPLLGHAGPLSDTAVRLKLIFALGLLPTQMYQDIDRLIRFERWLSHEPQEYNFTDEVVLSELGKLNTVQEVGFDHVIPPTPHRDESILDFQMRSQRHQQLVKSILALAIDKIVQHLSAKSPI